MLTENLEHFYLQNVDESDPKHFFWGHLHFVHCVRYVLILFRFTHDNQNSIAALKAYTRNSSHPLLRLRAVTSTKPLEIFVEFHAEIKNIS